MIVHASMPMLALVTLAALTAPPGRSRHRTPPLERRPRSRRIRRACAGTPLRTATRTTRA